MQRHHALRTQAPPPVQHQAPVGPFDVIVGDSIAKREAGQVFGFFLKPRAVNGRYVVRRRFGVIASHFSSLVFLVDGAIVSARQE